MQLGFAGVASPLRALDLVVAAVSSPAWDSGAADYLLGLPITQGLGSLRGWLLNSDAACQQGKMLAGRCAHCTFIFLSDLDMDSA